MTNYAGDLEEQIEKTKELLKQLLWKLEETREIYIQLKVQKSMLFINNGIGAPR